MNINDSDEIVVYYSDYASMQYLSFGNIQGFIASFVSGPGQLLLVQADFSILIKLNTIFLLVTAFVFVFWKREEV